MRDRLPVYIENRELPVDELRERVNDKEYSYGYVNVLYLASVIITIASVLTIIVVGK